MAFLALCSFFFILQYSRFLFRKSSSDSPWMGFGGTMLLTGAHLVEDCVIFVELWIWAQGVFIGLRVEDGLWPGDSMGCRSILDSGFSGGLRVGREESTTVLLGIHSWEDSETLAKLVMFCEDPTSLLFSSLLVTGSVSGGSSALHVVWLTAKTWGTLITAAPDVAGGLVRCAGLAWLTPLTALSLSPGVWETKYKRKISFHTYRQLNTEVKVIIQKQAHISPGYSPRFWWAPLSHCNLFFCSKYQMPSRSFWFQLECTDCDNKAKSESICWKSESRVQLYQCSESNRLLNKCPLKYVIQVLENWETKCLLLSFLWPLTQRTKIRTSSFNQPLTTNLWKIIKFLSSLNRRCFFLWFSAQILR